jgi:hypothetical protein
MHTQQGYYTVEFFNLMTKLDGTADTFASLITDITMQLSKRIITLEVKDANDGSTFRFIKTLETDSEWLLRITMLQEDSEPSYKLRFRDMKIKKHDVAFGSTITHALLSGFGLPFERGAVNHTLQLTFGAYEIED